MLKEFELSLTVLNDVLDNNVPFADTLKNQFKTNVDIRPFRASVAGLSGCELRHQIYFDYMLRGFADFDAKQKRLLSLALANSYFYRRFDVETVKQGLAEVFSAEQLERCEYLFELASNPDKYIPEEVNRRSALYLSLRFNVPEWAVKIISHFGGQATYQSLRKFARPSTITLRARTSALSLNALLETGNYEETAVPGILSYRGKESVRKVPEFRKGLLFAEKMLTKKIIDEHIVSEPDEVLLYDGNADASLELELIETYGNKVGLNIGVPDADQKVEVARLIKEKGLHNVNFFSAKDPTFLDAAVSKQQKLVIAAPNSTNFDLIPNSPDYLLHFDTDSMDALLDQEKKTLEGASKYVDEGGTLLYIVYTISKKEGRQTVADFLKAHPEFVLVNEKQHFPHEPEETAAYVAELRKGEAELTIPTPFADLASITPAPTVSTSASNK